MSSLSGTPRENQKPGAKLERAAVAAGLIVQRVEVDKAGKIIVVVGEPDKAECHQDRGGPIRQAADRKFS
jgi:hypothetical protein